MKTKAFPPKFNSFEDLLRSFKQNDPDRTVFIYEDGGAPVRKSRADFAASVLVRAEEMRSFGMTCLGVLCDGSLDCVETIFASAVAGLQTVLLDENAADTLLQEQIRQTDIDILWSSDPDLVEDSLLYFRHHGKQQGCRLDRPKPSGSRLQRKLYAASLSGRYTAVHASP